MPHVQIQLRVYVIVDAEQSSQSTAAMTTVVSGMMNEISWEQKTVRVSGCRHRASASIHVYLDAILLTRMMPKLPTANR